MAGVGRVVMTGAVVAGKCRPAKPGVRLERGNAPPAGSLPDGQYWEAGDGVYASIRAGNTGFKASV